MADQLDRLKEALSDRYRIERELGAGGMATVYVAQDLKHNRKVAVKVLRPELAASLGAARFLREIEITSQLNHPNILTLIDSGASDDTLYYVMPYLEGESLRERLNRERQLPVDDAVTITKEVADALGYAHSRGLIHRDIKPENIMFEAGHAVVTDFGIARAVTAAGGETLTETGLAVGTPAYMSPEQAAGEREIDARSDVYSLGCVLYETLAGEAPYSAPTPQALIAKKLSEPTPRISVVREVVPYGVEVALERALAKTPVDRFTTAEEFIKALEAPVVRPAVTTGRKLRIGAAATAVAILVIAAALLLPRWSGEAFDPNRVLVVEFEDNSGLEDAAALGSMAQVYIMQILTDAGFAKVVDHQTVLAASQNVAEAGMAGGPGEILALAHEGQAGTVVSGNYYAQGDSVHVQARITDASDGSVRETVGPIVGSIGRRSELVGRLGEAVTAELAALFDQDLGSWEPAVRPASYEAYKAYMEGLEAYIPGEFDEAASHFERAASADTTFYTAMLWAAQSHSVLSRWSWAGNLVHYAKAESLVAPLLESREQLSRYESCRLDLVIAIGIRRNARRAYDAARCMVQEAPGSDDAKRELATFAYRVNRPGEAVELLRELDPDRGLMKGAGGYWAMLCQAYHWLGDYEGELEAARQWRQRFPENPGPLLYELRALAALGRLDDVAVIVEAGRSLASQERLGSWLGSVAFWLRIHGHRDAARELFDESIVWFQSRPLETVLDTVSFRGELAEFLYLAERWDEAQRLYEKLAEENPETDWYRVRLGTLAARRGDREEALRISEEFGPSQHTVLEGRHTLWRATIAAALGEREQATTLLRQAYVQRGWFNWADLHYNIDFESLHDYPPYREFMRPKG
ncbi:MAG: protein kinase [Gemmatimonadota bacterium]|nr:MAG: protein kinase [Gemmatimonadota bacterium]